MALVDRANNLLPLLLGEQRLNTGEIMFVAHSFGGLIVEQVLRIASDRAPNDNGAANFVNRVSRVSFLGTPHHGADLATWAGRFRLVTRASPATSGLARNDPNLRGLNQWYRGYAHQSGLATQTLTEMKSTWWGLIVKPDNADPGLPSAPTPVNENHYSIATPASRTSEVYVLVRNFLSGPAPKEARRTLVAEEAVNTISEIVGENRAALERIEQTVNSQAAMLERSSVPGYLVDGEVSKRLERLKKGRFFNGSNAQDDAMRFAGDLLTGDLSGASADVKSNALAWSARLLLALPNRSQATNILNAANATASTEQAAIVAALAESYEGNITEALRRLSQLDSAAARSASFIVISNSRNATDALAWLKATGLQFNALDTDGRFFWLRRQLDAARWKDALTNAISLQADDFERSPALLYVAADSYLANSVPEELAAAVLWNILFDAASIPMFDDPISLNNRRQARDLYSRASAKAYELGCTRAGDEAADRALWLALRDPGSQAEARTILEQSMREPVLRRVPLAMQFGLKLDLDVVEREADRLDALSGGASAEVAIARFAIAISKTPKERAAYIDQHREQLARHLNPNFVTAVEVESLAHSGQIELAEVRLQALGAEEQSRPERDRLERVIAEAKGSDPIESREQLFKSSDLLTDLVNLIEVLHAQKDWSRLAIYGKELFGRTKDLAGCHLYAEALYETSDFKRLVELLSAQADLVDQSDYLQTLLAWSFYKLGNIKGSRELLAALRAKRDDSSDRLLHVFLAVTSGDWSSLAVFVENEWTNRTRRSPEDLLRAGQLAQQVGSPRSKAFIAEAATRGSEDPQVLSGAYSLALKGGWEDENTAAWIAKAAQLSGADGPVRQVSLQEFFDLHPDWQRRETKTWNALHAGTMPLFAAGRVLNRSLIEMYLFPALSNAETSDPRRRSLIYSFSGARRGVSDIPRVATFDATALLTAGSLSALGGLLEKLDKIVIPHSTLAWLFEEKQRIQFHQPSRIAKAREIRRLVDEGLLERFESTAPADNELAAEIGDDLAALLIECDADSGENGRQRLVVRSAPIHRVNSLMEEPADIGHHVKGVCSCTDLVNALARQAQLTQAEAQKAREQLAVREEQWPESPEIMPRAILYLDGLSVAYLQHLGLLSKIGGAGFKAVVPGSIVTEADNFLRYETTSERATAIVEDIRRTLSEGLETGKVILAQAMKQDEPLERMSSHPSFEVIEASASADASVIDDRYFNQHPSFRTSTVLTPVWTTLDFLTSSLYSPVEHREFRVNLRRSGFGFIPISAEELVELVREATVSDEKLVEGAELKAIRENLQMSRMSNGLQLPKEIAWFERFAQAFSAAIRAQWGDEIDDASSRARSNWLLAQFDIRHWSHRYGSDDNAAMAQQRFGAQVLSFCLFNRPVSGAVKVRYWKWVDDTLLKLIQDEQHELYDKLVLQVSAMIDEAVARAKSEYGK